MYLHQVQYKFSHLQCYNNNLLLIQTEGIVDTMILQFVHYHSLNRQLLRFLPSAPIPSLAWINKRRDSKKIVNSSFSSVQKCFNAFPKFNIRKFIEWEELRKYFHRIKRNLYLWLCEIWRYFKIGSTFHSFPYKLITSF